MTTLCNTCPRPADHHLIFGEPIDPELWHELTSGRVRVLDTMPQPLKPTDVYRMPGDVWPGRTTIEMPTQREPEKDLARRP